LVRGELIALKNLIQNKKASQNSIETKYHLEDCLVRIDAILDPK
jgi:hypothetical protein